VERVREPIFQQGGLKRLLIVAITFTAMYAAFFYLSAHLH
jgi:hypothetical protein